MLDTSLRKTRSGTLSAKAGTRERKLREAKNCAVCSANTRRVYSSALATITCDAVSALACSFRLARPDTSTASPTLSPGPLLETTEKVSPLITFIAPTLIDDDARGDVRALPPSSDTRPPSLPALTCAFVDVAVGAGEAAEEESRATRRPARSQRPPAVSFAGRKLTTLPSRTAKVSNASEFAAYRASPASSSRNRTAGATAMRPSKLIHRRFFTRERPSAITRNSESDRFKGSVRRA
mmetsp:Transcript_27344/g.89504  ORF Transcript_27344/g.89504 Transcript_27344/m.89504 type:complete len:238 (-) Transcript_27344:217-930(-)